MTTTTLTRWILPAVLATGFVATALAPAPARANDDLVRVIVDVADVMMRGSTPYYRHGNYGQNDRLLVSYDRYGRPVYYRNVPRRHHAYRPGPPPHARHSAHELHPAWGDAGADPAGPALGRVASQRRRGGVRADRGAGAAVARPTVIDVARSS